jgi:hypothetical protein
MATTCDRPVAKDILLFVDLRFLVEISLMFVIWSGSMVLVVLCMIRDDCSEKKVVFNFCAAKPKIVKVCAPMMLSS